MPGPAAALPLKDLPVTDANTPDADPRARGRELALALLCHLETIEPQQRGDARQQLLDDPPQGDALGEDDFATLAANGPARTFALRLLDLIDQNWTEIDEWISQASQRWRIERMDRVDRNVIRIATAELAKRSKTPRGVVLSEAVRLASRYGSERSARFVNGVSQAIAQRLRPGGDGR